ncbi:PAS domain S-box protein [Sphingomonas ginsenosidivorax]|uniref:histidine kinase n=1 Tax=Sphingomonas ginsenosidivorax TaxID=862135 RepID=A0A5C6U9D9_9SPHN|nr:ATP-binding protein [Sphingomonas ginsenosidivorax]TXC69653.1 PAS domain S-box protein [Sphingomonas ginsenosidivorax]
MSGIVRTEPYALLAIVLGGAGLLARWNGYSLPEGYANAGHAANPLALLAYMALAGAGLGGVRGWGMMRRVLLAVPVFIIALAVFRISLGTRFATGSLIALVLGRPQATALIDQFKPVGVITVATLGMLTLATAIINRSGRGATWAIVALVSVAMGVSIVAGVAVVTQVDAEDAASQAMLPALLPIAQAIPIGIGLLLWRGRYGWSDILALGATPGRMFRRAFPLVMMVPALIALFDIFTISAEILPTLIADIFIAGCNIAIFSALMLWSMTMVSAEHVALAEATTAIRSEREAELLEQHELLQSILKTVPSALVVFDARGVIKAFSASAERIFGHAAKDVIGCSVEILSSGPDRNSIAAYVTRYLATGVREMSDGTRPLYARRRDGTMIPVELWLGDLQVGPNRLFTGFWKDISERLANEERLASMRSELLHVARLSAMGEMAAGLAHELNQPLAAMVYFLGAFEHLPDDETNRERGLALVRMASQQAMHTGEIVRRMRTFASNDDAEMRVEPIAEVLDDAIAVTFLDGGRYDIQLVYDLDPAAVNILADRVQIQQVFVNLVRNAMEELGKSPPGHRTITIATELIDPETVAFSVADTGPGIDAAMIEQLGMPFFTTKGTTGMGLGLSISRRIIEAHGGVLTAANGPAGGAVFRFTLPHIDA